MIDILNDIFGVIRSFFRGLFHGPESKLAPQNNKFRQPTQHDIDRVLMESFPASDPPPWR